MDDPRQMQGVVDPQSESVKHSSYEHPPVPKRISSGKQRPFTPSVHWESEEHAQTPTQAGPGPRCEGQHAGSARWEMGTSASPA